MLILLRLPRSNNVIQYIHLFFFLIHVRVLLYSRSICNLSFNFNFENVDVNSERGWNSWDIHRL